MKIPDTAELERALNYLKLERVNNPAAAASAILRAADEGPMVTDFINFHTAAPAAFANGVLVGLKIAELREQDSAHVLN